MSKWEECSIGEIAEYVNRGISPKYVEGEGIPVINQKCIRHGVISIDHIKYHNVEKSYLNDKLLRIGDILINSTGIGTAGRVAMFKLNGVFLVDSHVSILRINHHKAYPQYVFYNLRKREDEIESYAEGSTGQVELGREKIKSIDISFPSLPEQKAIASVLSSLDDKIDLLHRQNKTLEAMAETLFRQWFVEEAKDNWEEVKIADFVELNRASIDKNYPYQTIEYLDTGSLISGKIESFQSFSLNDAPSRAKRLVQHNDVLISTVRPDQKHYGIIKNPIENLVVSTGFCVLTCTKIDPHFIYLLLTNDEMTDYLHTIAEGSTSTYPSLKPSDIGSIAFQLPPHSKLEEFSVIAQNLWEKIEKNHIQIRTLESLRDTLLPKLMSGEVRVDYP
ncbi:restriction endonuclease subunit S [Nitrosomonas sp. Is24]|uniref:restriction endonuclease subunit S n=1 Tax=Nitrosomonas sp. Is24 TaxID=3080533 RepID=UPI00294B8B06|nr:restriction endonuclease subunit S [Nitrosomonas sp. Is24]MDV6340704.1 restriction endonuclease subunit S [Nitrosomonas sp. Is24]